MVRQKKMRERDRGREDQKEAGLLQVEGEADLLHLMVKQRTENFKNTTIKSALKGCYEGMLVKA